MYMIVVCDILILVSITTQNMPIYIWDLNGPGNFYGFPSEPTLPGQVRDATFICI